MEATVFVGGGGGRGTVQGTFCLKIIDYQLSSTRIDSNFLIIDVIILW